VLFEKGKRGERGIFGLYSKDSATRKGELESGQADVKRGEQIWRKIKRH